MLEIKYIYFLKIRFKSEQKPENLNAPQILNQTECQGSPKDRTILPSDFDVEPKAKKNPPEGGFS